MITITLDTVLLAIIAVTLIVVAVSDHITF